MQPIYKDEAEASSFKKEYFRKYHLDNTPMQVVLNISGKYPLLKFPTCK